MKNQIEITGARVHNLKNVSLTLPRDRLIVFSGVSGSGKSSMAFDTVYAEGQRRYVESLSSYARQFLGIMDKPDVDFIEGLSPAISIEQKSRSKNPRSTVGTVTEIHDYLRILFARIGNPHCPHCGRPVGKQSPDEMIERILEMPEGARFMILAPVLRNRKGEYREFFEKLRRDGFVRIKADGMTRELDDSVTLEKNKKHNVDVVVDRLTVRSDIRSRLADSVDTALKMGGGKMIVETEDGGQKFFSEELYCMHCDISLPEMTPQTFSFNAPQGMCPECNGLGIKKEVDVRRIIPNSELSVMEGGIRFWGKLKKKKDNWNYKRIMDVLNHYGIDPESPVRDYPPEILQKILYGDKEIKTQGVVHAVKRLYRETHSPEMRFYYESFMGEKECEACGGKRLNSGALSVTLGGKNIAELSSLSIAELFSFFSHLSLNEQEAFIAKELIKEINSRLLFLLNVGLYYLMLDRKAPTLSGGESQRIRLASQIGSGLMGVLYILDEPSIGLHQRDNVNLINSLKNLRDLGNTVIVVEHDRDTIEEADRVVEFGPGAGVYGGEIVFTGTPEELKKDKNSLTGKYLRYEKNISPKEKERPLSDQWLELKGCRQNNLKNIDVAIPLGVMTLITGVSGSGKSSLISDTLYPALHNRLHKSAWETGEFDGMEGSQYIDKVIEINQDAIGRTPRSNPVTYAGVFTPIRDLFASLPEAKIRGYKQGRFSFNVKGGRCEACGGTGLKEIEMHFLPDLYVTCDVCKGRRYNKETLEVRYNGKNINDVLEMTVAEAKEFFANIPAISNKLETLYDVGLGYIKLGQSATTLSGGEAQRVKLAKELSRQSTGQTLYILDEPTTGLHFDDVNKLLKVLNRLVDSGNTMVIIEHNLDVVKYADWIIDLGPEGGKEGGHVLYAGRLEGLFAEKESYTASFLGEYLAKEHERPLTGAI